MKRSKLISVYMDEINHIAEEHGEALIDVYKRQAIGGVGGKPLSGKPFIAEHRPYLLARVDVYKRQVISINLR